jgi:hypothetical protein
MSLEPPLDVLAPFKAAAEFSARREGAYRREAEARIADLERERAHAYRRLNLVAAMLSADVAEERETSIPAQLVAAFRFMEHIEASLDELDEAGRETCARLEPVAAALHDIRHVDDGRPGPDLPTTMAAFEDWYAQRFGRSFWDSLDRTVSFSPVVDF